MEEHYLQKLTFLLAWLHSKINNIFDVHWCLPTFFFYLHQLHRLEYRNTLLQEEPGSHIEIVTGI